MLYPLLLVIFGWSDSQFRTERISVVFLSVKAIAYGKKYPEFTSTQILHQFY
jgi:hypothetical protein